MLSKDFVFLVLVACALSIPFAYYLMDEWLQKYVYRIELTAWTFLFTLNWGVDDRTAHRELSCYPISIDQSCEEFAAGVTV